MPPRKLTEQEEKFCVAIACMGMIDTAAVRYAGFVVRQPHNKAFNLKKRPDIAERLTELRATSKVVEEAPVAIPASTASVNDAEAFSLDWLLHEHLANLTLSKSRNDTRESRA